MNIMEVRQAAIRLAKQIDQNSTGEAVSYKVEASANCDRVFGLYEDPAGSEVYHWLDTGVTTNDVQAFN